MLLQNRRGVSNFNVLLLPVVPSTPAIQSIKEDMTSLKVTWTSPDIAAGRKIVGYKLTVRRIGKEEDDKIVERNSIRSECVVHGLQRNTTYALWVSVRSTLSYSNISQPRLATTRSDAGGMVYKAKQKKERNFIHIYMYVYMYVCMYVCVYLSIYLSIYLPTYLPICLSVCLSVCLSIYLSVYQSIYLSVCMFVCRSVFICLSVCLPILQCEFNRFLS